MKRKKQVEDKNIIQTEESNELNLTLQNILEALSKNEFFLRFLLSARALLIGQSRNDGQKLLKAYTRSEYITSLILSPSEMLGQQTHYARDYDKKLLNDFKNFDVRHHIRMQSDIEGYYKKLEENKKIKFNNIFSDSISHSLINELTKIQDLDVLKILFCSQLRHYEPVNSQEFFNQMRQFAIRVIDLLVKEEKVKKRMIVRGEIEWNKLGMVWNKEARKFGWPGFFDLRFILAFVIFCTVLFFIIKVTGISKNSISLISFLLLGLTIPIYFIPDLRDVRVEFICGSTASKLLINELARKGVVLDEKLLPLMAVSKNEEKAKNTVISYKLAELPPLPSKPQVSILGSLTNYCPSFLQKKPLNKFPNFKKTFEEEKKSVISTENKIHQALAEIGYHFDDEDNPFSPKLVKMNDRLVIFNYDEKSLKKSMQALDNNSYQIVEKSIRTPNPQRFGMTLEQISDETIFLKGWIDGRHLRMFACRQKIINLGPELGSIKEYMFTKVTNDHEQTDFLKNPNKGNSKTQKYSIDTLTL